jgi:hypothetical protein
MVRIGLSALISIFTGTGVPRPSSAISEARVDIPMRVLGEMNAAPMVFAPALSKRRRLIGSFLMIFLPDNAEYAQTSSA